MILFFFFNDTATTEIYTLSLHDALPILGALVEVGRGRGAGRVGRGPHLGALVGPVAGLELAHRDVHLLGRGDPDRKSTRLNSSHANISYAVFCLKKKKITYYYFI